VTQKELHY